MYRLYSTIIRRKAISTYKRSLAKTLSWRIIATSDTFLISWIITGTWQLAGAIASIEVMTKMALYYFHERAWAKIGWERDPQEEHTKIFPFNDKKIRRIKNGSGR